ncbi:hypothetical protein R1flu_001739 [Riccia fluitans]|uniref:Uncharacterized protein n=1 Tax=Riccia fluitans TaxID=41844 RepID=A0ABD1Y564_9MARC
MLERKHSMRGLRNGWEFPLTPKMWRVASGRGKYVEETLRAKGIVVDTLIVGIAARKVLRRSELLFFTKAVDSCSVWTLPADGGAINSVEDCTQVGYCPIPV